MKTITLLTILGALAVVGVLILASAVSATGEWILFGMTLGDGYSYALGLFSSRESCQAAQAYLLRAGINYLGATDPLRAPHGVLIRDMTCKPI